MAQLREMGLCTGTQSHTHYTTYKDRETAKYTPSRGIGGGQRGDDGNGG